MENKVLDQLLAHRTYREFDETYSISESELQQILAASQQAPSWMNGQFYSIFVIQDPQLREKLVALNPSNPHILKSSAFLIFVADLKRTQKVAQHYGSAYQTQTSLDPLLTAVTDTALALENAVVATESLGLGCVVVGSLRRQIDQVATLLKLPDHMLPLAGLAIGKPITEMKVKPRLPQKVVVHYDTYQDYDYQAIEQYDQTMEAFAEARETKRWSVKFADYFAAEPNFLVDKFIQMKKIYQPNKKV